LEGEIGLEAGFCCFPAAMDGMLQQKSSKQEVHPDADIEAILRQHEKVFAEELSKGISNAFKPIDLELADPKLQMPRSLQAKARVQPLAWESDISKQLKAYVEQGIIETCSSTFWSQILMVKKADGKLRMCVDYRYINKLLKHKGWPLPNIQELIRKLKGNTHFGKVDMVQGYHQLSIGLGSELTAFRANGQTYKFRKCPFGLKSAPPYFAFQMQTRILDGLEGICLIYLDDCIIFGRSREEYLANMATVLARFEERGILIKRSKCEFGLEEITFLGHIVSGDSVKLSDSRKQALEEMSRPKTVSQLRSFLGCSNYFRQFIDSYATMSRDLHQLVAKSPTKIIAWSPSLILAWETVKCAVVAAPKLKFLSDAPTDEIILYTDASAFAFGGHLVQRQNGIEESILFYSKSFNEVQSRWSVSDKEMFSIVHGVLANHYLLMGRKFTIRSDHKALMFNERVSASNKIERWKVSLSEYDINWEFIEGSKNVVADAMSRVIDPFDPTKASFGEDNDEEPFAVLLLHESRTSNVGEQIEDDLEVSLEQWQMDKIKIHHSKAHFGHEDTEASLKKAGYEWRHMTKHVKEFNEACKICQLLKTHPNPAHNSSFTLKSDKPGEQISMDIMEYDEDFYGYSFILVMVDNCHSYTTLIPLKTIRAGEIYHALVKYFCDDGVPDSLRFDQGASLNASIITSLLEFFSINAIVTAARSSQENGIAEQKIAKVREVIRLLLEEQVGGSDVLSWSSVVPFAQRAVNVMKGSIGYTPAEVRFGLFNRLEGLSETAVPVFIAEAQQSLADSIKAGLAKKNFKKVLKEGTIFAVNEKVIIKNPTHLKRNSAHKPYLGPFRVVKQGASSVTVVLDADPKVIKEVRTSEVFRFKESPIASCDLGTVTSVVLGPNSSSLVSKK
jgi:hypothetical protein